MGSFQQISIGIVCLAAAFAFGNYVNNHPPADHPHEGALATQPPSGIQFGNVQSRIAGTDQEVIEKRAAPINTMRSPLNPKFQMPLGDVGSVAETKKPGNALPPPSELGRRATAGTQPGTSPAGNSISRLAVKADVPDFSSIVSEFKNTQIELPPLGKMPVHTNPLETQKANAKPIAIRDPARQKPISNDIPELAVATNNRWNTEQAPAFEADDFAPRLKDRFSAPVAQTNSNPNQADQGIAESFGFTYAEPPNPNTIPDLRNTQSSVVNSAVDNSKSWTQFDGNQLSQMQLTERASDRKSNHVVSREPLPRLPSSNGNALARIRNYADSMEQVASHGTSVLEANALATPGVQVAETQNRVRTMLPFGLNEQGKSQLVAIKSQTNSKLELETTRFAAHVIQEGETLQSISTRYFGKPDFYLDIYLANRGKLRNPIDTPDGTAIRIPIY